MYLEGKAAGKAMGVGISMGGFIITIGMFDQAEAALELMPDGGITCYDTWEDVGQGGDIGSLTHTVKALVASSQEDIYTNGFLECVPVSGATYESTGGDIMHYRDPNYTFTDDQGLLGDPGTTYWGYNTLSNTFLENITTRPRPSASSTAYSLRSTHPSPDRGASEVSVALADSNRLVPRRCISSTPRRS